MNPTAPSRRRKKILNYIEEHPEGIGADTLGYLLGVSHFTIWKDIKALRNEGHIILSDPSGYRFPDSESEEDVFLTENSDTFVIRKRETFVQEEEEPHDPHQELRRVLKKYRKLQIQLEEFSKEFKKLGKRLLEHGNRVATQNKITSI